MRKFIDWIKDTYEIILGIMGMIVLASGLIAFVVFAFKEALKEEVLRNPIDVRYSAEHTEIETTYEYQVDLLGEETFKLMPNTHTQHYPEKWEVLYRVSYSDGSTKDIWETVSNAEYEVVFNKLKGDEE